MATIVSYALTNLADVKESLGIASGNTTKDNLIIRKINQITDAIENYCQRRFAVTSYIEEYAASQIDVLVLRQRPIVIDGTHTFTLEWRTTAFNDSQFETVDAQLYFVDEPSGVMNLMFNAVGHWNRYRITYSAGYTPIPNDLAEAANLLACYFVNNPNAATAGVQQISEGQRATRYFQKNNFYNILQQLGIDQTIDAYADEPVLADR